MPAFSVSPLIDATPPTGDDAIPRFLQLQAMGENLGGPDADTIDFADGLEATRGVGENSHVVTVKGAASSGGGASYGAITLNSAHPFAFDNIALAEWVPDLHVANDDWQWDDLMSQLQFVRAGWYRIMATCRLNASNYLGWPPAASTFGSSIWSIRSVQSRYYDPVDGSDDGLEVIWTDQQLVFMATDEPTNVEVSMWAKNGHTDEYAIADAKMKLVIERLGD